MKLLSTCPYVNETCLTKPTSIPTSLAIFAQLFLSPNVWYIPGNKLHETPCIGGGRSVAGCTRRHKRIGNIVAFPCSSLAYPITGRNAHWNEIIRKDCAESPFRGAQHLDHVCVCVIVRVCVCVPPAFAFLFSSSLSPPPPSSPSHCFFNPLEQTTRK